jgi:hypothetical protein
MRVFLVPAGAGERAAQASRRGAHPGAGQPGDQPPGRDDGAATQDGEGADAGEQPRAAAQEGAERGADAGAPAVASPAPSAARSWALQTRGVSSRGAPAASGA